MPYKKMTAVFLISAKGVESITQSSQSTELLLAGKQVNPFVDKKSLS